MLFYLLVNIIIPYATNSINKENAAFVVVDKSGYFYGGEGGIRPPAGGPPRVARRPRRLAKCPRFESLHAVKNEHPPPVGEGCQFLDLFHCFDRFLQKGVHRLFRGVHYLFRGCKRQRGCKVNDLVR